MLASSNVVALLAEQNSQAGKSKCLAGQETKTDESVNSLNCAADEAGKRKKRLDNIGNILETLDEEHCLKSSKSEEQDDVIGATSLLTGEESFGIKEKRGGLPGLEPGLGKIGRRQGKRDRKVGSYSSLYVYLRGTMIK